jgi:hypothetical protein
MQPLSILTLFGTRSPPRPGSDGSATDRSAVRGRQDRAGPSMRQEWRVRPDRRRRGRLLRRRRQRALQKRRISVLFRLSRAELDQWLTLLPPALDDAPGSPRRPPRPTRDEMTDTSLLTDGARPAVRLERRRPDPPAVVWKALTEREQLRSWVPSDVSLTVDGGSRRDNHLPVPARSSDVPPVTRAMSRDRGGTPSLRRDRGRGDAWAPRRRLDFHRAADDCPRSPVSHPDVARGERNDESQNRNA